MAVQGLRGTPINYEPKRANRFELSFPTELNIETWLVQMVKRPTVSQNNVEIQYLNTSQWVPGRYTWSEFDIELLDHIGPSSSQKAMEWFRLQTESVTGRMGYAFGYKKDLILKALDPTLIAVENWVMKECHITNIDFGQNDHSDDSIQKVKMTLQPHYCVLTH